jgi:NarL family two-component system sensor histidine kinase LiaS
LAVLEERNRLARDLHDSAKQQAFAVAAQLGAARSLLGMDSDRAAARIDEAERLAYDLRQELTNLVHQLRPVDLTLKGLPAALTEYARAWSQRNGIVVEIDTQAGLRLPAKVEESFFRIAQEALANVARHSGAQRVEVRLIETPTALVMQIGDDGCGFDAATVQRGVGLDSMAERSRAIHADLRIKSEPGQGTTVTVHHDWKGKEDESTDYDCAGG